jgi:hypothetical protein
MLCKGLIENAWSLDSFFLPLYVKNAFTVTLLNDKQERRISLKETKLEEKFTRGSTVQHKA